MVSLLEGTWRQLSRTARRQAAVLAAAAVALAPGALVAGSAHAGEFHLYSCRTPSGAAAPADGWSPSHTGPYTYAENTCAQGGSLIAALRPSPGRTANTDIATWEFAAPTPERIAAATLWRAARTLGRALVRIERKNAAEIKNDTASMPMANGAAAICRKLLPRIGPAISATDLLASSLPLPSTSC